MVVVKAVYKKQKQGNNGRTLNAYPPIIAVTTSNIRSDALQTSYPFCSRNTILLPNNNIIKPIYTGEAPPPYPGIIDSIPSNVTSNINTSILQRQSNTISNPIIMRIYDNNLQNSLNEPPPYEDLPGSTNRSQNAIFFPNPIMPDPHHVLPQKFQ
uniref:Uncharacterized protein n=1 Tax=Parastrongyloides trichosuri TaxID=131310 RepID=A0A0N4ZUE9_PARTI